MYVELPSQLTAAAAAGVVVEEARGSTQVETKERTASREAILALVEFRLTGVVAG